MSSKIMWLIHRENGASMTTKKAAKQAARRLKDARVRMYHDLIFESAEGIFGRKGYDGATMQDIADGAGVSLKTLYVAYKSKDDLYAQIMRERAGGFVAAMNSTLEGVSAPVERLERIVGAYAAYLSEHEDWMRIHLHSRAAWAFRPADVEVAVSWEESRSVYARVLADGIEAGVFHSGEPQELAVLVQTLMQVQMAHAIERGETNPEQIAESMLVHLRRLICV
jgi:AcrR family transcriptional regulator